MLTDRAYISNGVTYWRRTETMSDKSRRKPDRDRFCVIDHANKQADRERTNPNRLRKPFSRTLYVGPGECPEDSVRVWRKRDTDGD